MTFENIDCNNLTFFFFFLYKYICKTFLNFFSLFFFLFERKMALKNGSYQNSSISTNVYINDDLKYRSVGESNVDSKNGQKSYKYQYSLLLLIII